MKSMLEIKANGEKKETTTKIPMSRHPFQRELLSMK